MRIIQGKQNVLIMVAKACAKNCQSAAVCGVFFYADFEPDKRGIVKVQIAQADIGQFMTVDTGIFVVDAQMSEQAVLAVAAVPPGRRELAAYIGNCPGMSRFQRRYR